jgi:hypothetical protein
VPAKVTFELYLYARGVDSPRWQVLTSLLEDTLPAFKESKKFDVTLRVPQVYQAMQHANLLMSVNPEELKERMLQRAEGSGPRGRPRKVRE